MNTTGLSKPDFVIDYNLPIETFNRNTNGVVKKSSYTQGHIASATHRSRTVQSHYYVDNTTSKYNIQKDYYLTHLMTNLLPEQKPDGMVDPWQELEMYLKDKLVGTYNSSTSSFDGAGKELYVISGGSGTKEFIVNQNPLYPNHPKEYYEQMLVPQDLWKVVLVLEPGQDLRDVTENTVAFAVQMPNDISRGNIDWTQYVISVNQLEYDTGYDLFSNIPVDIQETIENNSSVSLLPAALLADNQNSPELFGKVFSISSGEERTREKSPIRQNSLPQEDIYTTSSATSKTKVDIFGIPQASKSKVDTSQSSLTKNSSSQVSFHQISPSHISSLKISPTQTSPTQIGIPQVGSFEIDPLQVGLVTHNTNQTSFSEIKSAQITMDIVAVEIESHQVGSTQIASSIKDKLVNIISSPSGTIIGTSISPRTHSSDSSQIFSNIQFSATTIWSNLLQTPTQLNIDFQITDLPTGQLGEATITDYDENGKPISGTIQIDYNANGVGWFIDPTPLDNSEFLPQHLNSYLLAAAESEARDKYDLLTTILHKWHIFMGLSKGMRDLND
jgi:large repetitive protein